MVVLWLFLFLLVSFSLFFLPVAEESRGKEELKDAVEEFIRKLAPM
jgi:hypothetical protein